MKRKPNHCGSDVGDEPRTNSSGISEEMTKRSSMQKNATGSSKRSHQQTPNATCGAILLLHTASLSYVHEFATSSRHRGSFVADRGSFPRNRDSFAHDRDSFAREIRIRDNFEHNS